MHKYRFNTKQLAEMKQLAVQMRKSTISFEQYHVELSKFYNN